MNKKSITFFLGIALLGSAPAYSQKKSSTSLVVSLMTWIQ